MSITRSYNKNNDTYYAYEVKYVWSEEKHKKVPVKRCIGHFDPVTGEIVPNGKRGPKPVKELPSFCANEPNCTAQPQESIVDPPLSSPAFSDDIVKGLDRLNSTLREIASYLHDNQSSSQALT